MYQIYLAILTLTCLFFLIFFSNEANEDMAISKIFQKKHSKKKTWVLKIPNDLKKFKKELNYISQIKFIIPLWILFLLELEYNLLQVLQFNMKTVTTYIPFVKITKDDEKKCCLHI
jgi:Na+/H+ antiporter NhaC